MIDSALFDGESTTKESWLRECIDKVYDEALKDSIKNSSRQIDERLAPSPSDTPIELSSESSAGQPAQPQPPSDLSSSLFRLSIEFVENPRLLPIDTILDSLISASQDRYPPSSQTSHHRFIHPIDGIADRALLIIMEWETKVHNLYLKLMASIDSQNTRKGQKRVNSLASNHVSDSIHSFDWDPGVYQESASFQNNVNTIVIVLDYHSNFSVIASLLTYFRRVHAIYTRYSSLRDKFLSGSERQNPGSSLPKLPRVIMMLVRTAFSPCVNRFDALTASTSLDEISPERKRCITSRRRTFNFSSAEVFPSASGFQDSFDQYMHILEPLCAPSLNSPQNSSPFMLGDTFCQKPTAEPQMIIQLDQSAFMHSFFGRWIVGHPDMIPSSQLYLKLDFLLEVKSEGIHTFREAFFNIVMKHESKFPASFEGSHGEPGSHFLRAHYHLVMLLLELKVDFTIVGELYLQVYHQLFKGSFKQMAPKRHRRHRVCLICGGGKRSIDLLPSVSAPEAFQNSPVSILGNRELTRKIKKELCELPHEGDAQIRAIQHYCDMLLHFFWCSKNRRPSCTCVIPPECLLIA